MRQVTTPSRHPVMSQHCWRNTQEASRTNKCKKVQFEPEKVKYQGPSGGALQKRWRASGGFVIHIPRQKREQKCRGTICPDE